MILSPAKLIDKVQEAVRSRLGDGVEAVAFFVPRTALSEGMSKRDVARQGRRAAAFALTADRIHAFSFKDRGWGGVGSLEDELGSWPRTGARVATSTADEKIRLEDSTMHVSRRLVTIVFADGRSITLAADEGVRQRQQLADTFIRRLGG